MYRLRNGYVRCEIYLYLKVARWSVAYLYDAPTPAFEEDATHGLAYVDSAHVTELNYINEPYFRNDRAVV